MSESSLFPSPFVYESAFSYSNLSYPTKKYKTRNAFRSAFSYTYTAVPTDSLDELSESSEETFTARILRIFIISISYIFVFTLFPLSCFICLKRIHALERLVVLRLGKLQPVFGPGYRIILPVIDKWTRVDLQPKTFSVCTQQLLTTDRAIVEAVATVKYCVCHAVHYVIRLCNEDHPLQDLARHCLTNIVSEKEQSELDEDRNLITLAIKTELNRTILNWGLEVLHVDMPPVKVLKEAEKVHGIDAVLNVLKSVSTNWNQATSLSAVQNFHTSVPNNNSRSALDHVASIQKQDGTLLHKLNNWLAQAENDGKLCNFSATYELKIRRREEMQFIYIVLSCGKASVFQSEDGSFNPDVVIILAENDIESFIMAKTTPVQAYMEGRIQVIGNFHLLKVFADIFS